MNAPDRLDAIVVKEGIPKITFKRDTKVENACTFKVFREDHTLGNLLCHQLLRDRKVKFAGYQHPHPLENDILVKIQASADAASDATPLSVLKTAVDALKDEVDYVLDNFEGQIAKLRAERAEQLDD